MADSTILINDQMRQELIQKLVQKLVDIYVFPDVAEQMKTTIVHNMNQGEYNEIDSLEELSKLLTTHLQAVSKDKHIRVRYHEQMIQPEQSEEEWMEEFGKQALHDNFGFYKIERLAGNVGYIDVRGFMFPNLCNGLAAQTAISTMNLVANSNALIFDLRKNGGGSPEMVALILSYLFDEPTHINSFYMRENDQTKQFWTTAFVTGSRYGEKKPVYVLTSNYTFSAAEEFTYNLQNLKRATIIGEVTGGGAHPGGIHDLTPNCSVLIPSGRAINPITQTNWEGTGVQPDILVSKEEAYQVAYSEALNHILNNTPKDENNKLYNEANEALKSLSNN